MLVQVLPALVNQTASKAKRRDRGCQNGCQIREIHTFDLIVLTAGMQIRVDSCLR